MKINKEKIKSMDLQVETPNEIKSNSKEKYLNRSILKIIIYEFIIIIRISAQGQVLHCKCRI